MIRLRESMERWLRHPAVGPVLILCLAFVLAFLVLHEASEGSIETLLAACATLAAFLAVAVASRERYLPPNRGGGVRRARPRVRAAPPGVRPASGHIVSLRL